MHLSSASPERDLSQCFLQPVFPADQLQSFDWWAGPESKTLEGEIALFWRQHVSPCLSITPFNLSKIVQHWTFSTLFRWAKTVKLNLSKRNWFGIIIYSFAGTIHVFHKNWSSLLMADDISWVFLEKEPE